MLELLSDPDLLRSSRVGVLGGIVWLTPFMHGGRGSPRRSSRARTGLSSLGGGAPTLGAFALPLAFLTTSCLPVALAIALAIALTLSLNSLGSLVFCF